MCVCYRGMEGEEEEGGRRDVRWRPPPPGQAWRAGITEQDTADYLAQTHYTSGESVSWDSGNKGKLVF